MDIKIKNDNRKAILSELDTKIAKALEECGMMAETFASRKITTELNASPKSDWYSRTGALRNSIGHEVDTGKKQMMVGSSINYAVYIEFGTGIYADGGRKTKWVYKGSDGKFHATRGMKPRAFIKPAIADHMDTYQKVIKKDLS